MTTSTELAADDRRSRSTGHGLERRGKPVVLPIIAALLAVGGWLADRQEAMTDENPGRPQVGREETIDAPAVSATFHGLTQKGDYYQCIRPAEIRPQHPAYKRLLEACVVMPLPDRGDRR